MSWSRVFRLPQIYKDVHHSSSRYRCSLDSSWLTRNFVGPNSTRNGWDFSYEFRGVMTRCESSVGSFGKCGQLTPCLDVRRQYETHATREHKSKKMLLYLTGLVFAMVGCTYTAIPLYRRFCQATGYGGTVQRRESVEEKIARHAQDGTRTTREIVVQFNADVADGMQWQFVPTQRETNPKLLFALFRHDSGALFRDDSEAPLRLLQTRLRSFFSDTTSKLFFALEDYPVNVTCPRLRLKVLNFPILT